MPEHPFLIRSADVLGANGSTRELDRRVRSGDIVRVRHGAFAATAPWDAADGRARMLAAVAATRAAATACDPVFAFESAAAVLGIPIIGATPRKAHTVVGRNGSHTNASVIRTRRDESRIVRVGGVLTTSLIVTAIDLAATRSLLSGIVAMSHIRHHHGISVEEIALELRSRRPFQGVRRADLALRRSAGSSHTPAETLAVVRAEDLGFERPRQQLAMVGVDGRDYDVDLWWRGGRILFEIDGRSKYEIAAQERGQTVTDRMWAEKRREDALRPLCDRFGRATWDDLWNGVVYERALLAAGVPRPNRRRPLTF